MNTINAKIIADSTDHKGNRITSMLLTFPRFILPELNTHRMFSRNSASSRAIPFEKMVKMVQEDPFVPIAWQKKHKGMQGTKYLTHTYDIEDAIKEWEWAADIAVTQANILNDIGVTKQICNRLLEPFMWHTVLITATEYENFFKLRCPQYVNTAGGIFKSKKDYLNSWYLKNIGRKPSSDLEWLQTNQSQAEIHIQALAEAMWDAMNESTPKELSSGEWHMPFGNKIDMPDRQRWDNSKGELIEANIKVATARAARLSYMTFDNNIDYEKDFKLHDRLLKDGHMSPFEHCAKVMNDEEYQLFTKGYITENNEEKTTGWCNNFKGFIPYRYMVENNY